MENEVGQDIRRGSNILPLAQNKEAAEDGIVSDRDQQGKLVARFDSKKILLFTRLLFAIGSVLTGAAPSMNAFIIGKAITGIGSGGSYIAIIIIITALTSPHEHGRYFGYIGFVWGLGTMLV
ncbi:MAG: hypothetical protein LQ351_005670 [Letrouitia transgressa]|nr:MAG: hypothetical protein LQ351_005670 [Letrouitia transgressa]